ncbi:MAG: hypothetical protein LLG20_18240 [Acidobacteriales bacterium]|nr:hypothetical protein [Terriglobales bacterium]
MKLTSKTEEYGITISRDEITDICEALEASARHCLCLADQAAKEGSQATHSPTLENKRADKYSKLRAALMELCGVPETPGYASKPELASIDTQRTTAHAIVMVAEAATLRKYLQAVKGLIESGCISFNGGLWRIRHNSTTCWESFSNFEAAITSKAAGFVK